MLKGILHVNLTIDPGPEALAQAHRFYVDLLGLEELYRPPQTDNGRPGYWLGFENGQQIHISAEPNSESFNGPSGRHAAFQVADLKGLRQSLVEGGAEVANADQFPGQSRFFARDPWGNRLEFVEYE